MAFINQDRKSSVQSDRLNLKQTPADIWEYSDSDKDSTPQVWLKEPWELLYYKPPIGIPTFWFSSLPDWAIAFDDGAGPYDWVDYPEFDNATFKAMLTIWSNAGWMSAYDGTSFYVPDLGGMAFQVAGTSAVRQMANGSYFDGGNLGDYDVDMFFKHKHANIVNAGSGGSYVLVPVSGQIPIDSQVYSGNTLYANGYGTPNAGAKTKPATATIRLIVRFE